MKIDREITSLIPRMQPMVSAFLEKAKAAGLDVFITETYRSFERQAELYAQVPKFTSSPPGFSWHNWGRAFDIAFHGPELYPRDPSKWHRLGYIGESIGLQWGGRWKGHDSPHFQLGGMCSLVLRIEAKEFAFGPGQDGQLIEELQARLKQAGFRPGPIDGAFGSKTEAAVKAFQKRAGLPITGVFTLDCVEPLEDLLQLRWKP